MCHRNCHKGVTAKFQAKKNPVRKLGFSLVFQQATYGALGRIRTFDRSVRSRVLYPAELRVRRGAHIKEVAEVSQALGYIYLNMSCMFQFCHHNFLHSQIFYRFWVFHSHSLQIRLRGFSRLG